MISLVARWLGLDRVSPATIPILLVTGGGFLLVKSPLDPEAGALFTVLYWIVTALAVAMVAWGVLYLAALTINVATSAVRFRHRVGFRWPVYLRPEAAGEPVDGVVPPRSSAGAPAPNVTRVQRAISQRELAKVLGIPRRSVVAQIDALQAKGIVAPTKTDPETRVDVRRLGNTVLLIVKNDGPVAQFRVEVLGIRSQHFHDRAEATDWPWVVGWGTGSKTATRAIQSASSAECVLLLYDDEGAKRQLSSKGGYAFIFPSTENTQHRIHGRLGIAEMAELQAERLELSIRVSRLGGPDLYIERKLCVAFMRDPEFCDQI